MCIGYPREVSSKMIQQAYCDIMSLQAPDKDEYSKLFTVGNLSVSPGPLLAYNSSALACGMATTPGFSGSPVCLLKNPQMLLEFTIVLDMGKITHFLYLSKTLDFIAYILHSLFQNCVMQTYAKKTLMQSTIISASGTRN